MGFFEKSVRAASNKVLVEINLKCYQIAWELFTSVVNKTPSPSNPGPTAEGLLANQWYPMAGGSSGSKGSAKSQNGSGSLSRIQALMNGLEFYDRDGKITLVNNISYAVQAESEGWNPPRWKGTPPYRMVALSLQATVAKYKVVKI
jgi:hypothetical protein